MVQTLTAMVLAITRMSFRMILRPLSVDTYGDGKGNNADNDDDNDGYTDVHETSECMPPRFVW